MDPALIKERQKFIKGASNLSGVAVRIRQSEASITPQASKSSSSQISSASNGTGGVRLKRPITAPAPPPSSASETSFSFNASKFDAVTANKFSILAAVVSYLKERHTRNEIHPLSLTELLDEMKMVGVGKRIKMWLSDEALMNNPKIEVIRGLPSPGDTTGESAVKFVFKPKFPGLRDKSSLLRLLEKHDLKTLGGIFLDDVQESMGADAAEAALKALGERILRITRPSDKKVVLFYNDASLSAVAVDEEFRNHYVGASVEGLSETQIEEYLDDHGLKRLHDSAPSTRARGRGGRRGPGSKRPVQLRSNEHVAGLLQDYSKRPGGSLGSQAS